MVAVTDRKYMHSELRRAIRKFSARESKVNLPMGAGPPPKRCQYPLWDDALPPLGQIDQHFCHAAVKEGSSYCPAHHALCRVSVEEYNRRVAEWKATQKAKEDTYE